MALGNVSFHYNVTAISHSDRLLVILASASGCQRKTVGTDSGVRKVKRVLLTLLFLSVWILQQTACGVGINSCLFPLFSFLFPLVSGLLPALRNEMARARCQHLAMQSNLSVYTSECHISPVPIMPGLVRRAGCCTLQV